jgi:hypothetical protein
MYGLLFGPTCLAILEKVHRKRQEVISEVVLLGEALLELAFLPTTRDQKRGEITPRLRAIGHMQHAAMPTIYRLNCAFSRIVSVEKDWISPSGINCPKVVYMHCDDGRRHQMLVKVPSASASLTPKSGEDLRQDAVMEQMFDIVNVLLRMDPATRQRYLHIRTYKVIPLAPASGIVEWVDNTMTLSSYLIGQRGFVGPIKNSSDRVDSSSSAHAVFDAGGFSQARCVELMKSVRNLAPSKRTDMLEHVFANTKSPLMF